jgi:hypothetical protein
MEKLVGRAEQPLPAIAQYLARSSRILFQYLKQSATVLSELGRGSSRDLARARIRLLRRSDLRDQGPPSVDEDAALVGERDMPLAAAFDAEVVPQFVER